MQEMEGEMTDKYQDFLRAKSQECAMHGFDPVWMPSFLPEGRPDRRIKVKHAPGKARHHREIVIQENRRRS